MANKDIKLNIKLDAPANSQSNSFINKLTIALGLSLSTAFTDNLDFTNPVVLGGIGFLVIIIAIITNELSKKKT